MSKLEKLISELCPNGVEYKAFYEFGTMIRGNGLQKKDFTEKGVGCIHYGQIYTYYGTFTSETKTFVSEELANKLKKVNTGDLIIAITSENVEDVCKCVAWLGDNEIVTGGHSAIFKHNQDPKYLSYYFQTADFFSKKRKIANGTKVIEVSPKKLEQIRIPIPPLPVQREIVRILDNFKELTAELTAKLTAELTTRKQQYDYYRNKLLTFDTDSIEKAKLAEIADFRNGKGHERAINAEGKYIVVNSKFISTNGEVRKYSKTQICPLFVNDILIVMSDLPNGRALAKCYLVDEDDRYTLNQRIGSLRVKDADVVDSKFLYYVLNRNRQLLKYDNGVDQTNLKKDEILNILIPIPSLEEQQRIVAILDRFDTLVNDITQGLTTEIEARQKQYVYYRDKLLTFKEIQK